MIPQKKNRYGQSWLLQVLYTTVKALRRRDYINPGRYVAVESIFGVYDRAG